MVINHFDLESVVKQTAVEWLLEIVSRPIYRVPQSVIDKARQMEKEQLIGLLEWMNKVTAENPMRLETDNDDIVEQYLIETFKK